MFYTKKDKEELADFVKKAIEITERSTNLTLKTLEDKIDAMSESVSNYERHVGVAFSDISDLFERQETKFKGLLEAVNQSKTLEELKYKVQKLK